MLPVQNGEQRVIRAEQSKQGKHHILLLCLWCVRFHSQRLQTSIFAACIIQFLLISVPLSVCSSPWQMPHTLDVSNTLGTCAIFVCNILRNILIDSYSLQLQSATVCTPTHRSALLFHNPHQHFLWFGHSGYFTVKCKQV